MVHETWWTSTLKTSGPGAGGCWGRISHGMVGGRPAGRWMRRLVEIYFYSTAGCPGYKYQHDIRYVWRDLWGDQSFLPPITSVGVQFDDCWLVSST